MIGIYKSSFIDFLENRLSNKVKINAKNIITKCPWCDLNKSTSKNHMWISTEIPIFHCFRAGCEKSGFISKLVKKIEGTDISNTFIDEDIIKKNKIEKSILHKNKEKYQLPKIDSSKFPNKTLYLRSRLKFANIQLESIKGLIFDIQEFLNINKITLDEKINQLLPFLQSNFIGFLFEHGSKIIFRNIDPTSNFRYFKYTLRSNLFMDYYKINGSDNKSKKIVLSEGIFDIFPVKLFDMFDDKSILLYASVLSGNYSQVLKSIIYHEQLFKLDVIILSDLNIHKNYYRKLKKNNEHIINSLIVYYNKNGKDFNNFPLEPVKVII